MGATLSWSDPNIYAAGVSPTYTVSFAAIGNPVSSTSLTTSTTSATLTGLSLYTQYAASVTVSVGGSGSPAFTPVVAFTTLPGTFVAQTLCVTQNAVCNASSTNLISYGNYGSYVYVQETGSFSCDNSIAGFDPLPCRCAPV